MKGKALALSLLALGCASPRYLAKVDDHEIGGDEVLRAFGRQHVAMDKILGDEEDVRRMLPRVVERRLFVQEAYRLGLQDAPDVREATARFQREQLAGLFRKREIDDPAAASESEIAAAYAQMEWKLLVRQLVAASREQAEALRARAEGGADLDALARAESTAPSRVRGGLIVVQWGAPDVERERVAFALQEGQLGEVYRSELGWEFDHLEKRGPAQRETLEESRTRIADVLRQRKVRAAEKAAQDELWKKYDVQLQDCLASAEEIQKALQPDGAGTCATWTGGRLLAGEVVRRRNPSHLQQLPPQQAAEMVRAWVRDAVNRELFGREGEARGWDREPEIAAAVRFKREDLAEDKLYAEYVFRDVSASDEEAKALYQANRDKFVQQATFVLAHIVVETPEEAAQVQAALAGGAGFEGLAKERSKDEATAKKGGVVGFAREDQLQGPFAVVAKLAEGERSEVIHSRYGYHIVKVLKKQPSHQLTWEEAAEEAKRRVVQNKTGERYATWVARLKAEASIRVSDAGIKAFAQRRLEEVRAEETERAAKRGAAKPKPAGAAAEGGAVPPARGAAGEIVKEGTAPGDPVSGPAPGPPPGGPPPAR